MDGIDNGPVADLTYGIDEAGRGPVLGPMVMAVCYADDEAWAKLKHLGVKDSKSLSPYKREQMEVEIKDLCEFDVRVIRSKVIDRNTGNGKLNRLERKVAVDMLRCVEAAKDATIICDGERIFRRLAHLYPNLVAVNKGESYHVSVAAASVLAKCQRDREFERIKEKYKSYGLEKGGGYCNEATLAFLRAYVETNGDYPDEMRRSWDYGRTLTRQRTNP
jgi:ribonuclease HII